MDEERFEGEFGPLFAGLRGHRAACPPPERLTALAAGELPDAERAAIEEHCRLCPRCADELVRASAAPAEVDEVTWRRLERRLGRRPAPWRRSAARDLRAHAGYWIGLAATLALVAALPIWRGEVRPAGPPGNGSTTRGGGLQVLGPAGAVRSVERFAWASPPLETTYRIEVRRGEELVWSGAAPASPLVAPAELLLRLEPGAAYRWRVEAVGREGRTVVASGWIEFELLP